MNNTCENCLYRTKQNDIYYCNNETVSMIGMNKYDFCSRFKPNFIAKVGDVYLQKAENKLNILLVVYVSDFYGYVDVRNNNGEVFKVEGCGLKNKENYILMYNVFDSDTSGKIREFK